MNVRLRQVWDMLRSSYWFVPSVMTVSSVLVWYVTLRIDEYLQLHHQDPLPWLFARDVTLAQTLLLAVAGATIGVVGVVFSITTVPLTIAASQLGPRLLRNFLRDLGTQIVLGIFIATFVYCMLALVSLHTDQRVPQVTLTMSLVLAATDLGALVYYISHIAVEIQAPHVLAEVAAELLQVIDSMFPLPVSSPSVSAPILPSPMQPLPATASGYVQEIDVCGLVDVATTHDLVIEVLRTPGQFVTAHAPLVRVWPATTAQDRLCESITNMFILGTQRTLIQDVEFGMNSLVEVAVRALSPAINDPFTALTSIDWLGVALCRVCARAQPTAYHYDTQGALRVMLEVIDFRHLTDAACNLIREYGSSSATVSAHLLAMLAIVGSCARTEVQRAALRHHADLIQQDALARIVDTYDRQRVRAAYEQVISTIAGSAPSHTP